MVQPLRFSLDVQLGWLVFFLTETYLRDKLDPQNLVLLTEIFFHGDVKLSF